jgi:hypothetical protein
MTKTCIHFGSHHHLISLSDCHESIAITKELLRLEVEKNPIMTTLAIALVVSRTFLSLEWIGCGQLTTTKLQGAHLHGLMDRFLAFFSPNIKKFVLAIRHGNFKQGPLDNIH